MLSLIKEKEKSLLGEVYTCLCGGNFGKGTFLHVLNLRYILLNTLVKVII